MDNDDQFEELEARVDKLLNANAGIGGPITEDFAFNMAKEEGYSVQFVKYVLDSVDIHYRDEKLLRHMVRFTASQVKNPKIPFSEGLSAKEIHSISNFCSDLKNDIAFSIRPVSEGHSQSAGAEFPLLTRIAIVATYCASYNPQTSDKVFFFKGKDVLKRKLRGAAREENWHESGPRPFDHQRAMFIFLFFCSQFDEALHDSPSASSADFHFDSVCFFIFTRNFGFFSFPDVNLESSYDFTSQIAHLVDAGLLQMISAPENLDLPKYRSLCSLNFVEQIARSISSDFNLKSFLMDFASEK
ncbi:hypothetical protein niasHT_011043 [Heterodera trifolii]|uniref:Origin recognition complex subunit 5 C-terminal domain-containing protein n=1 Tax=Heterodera trifolii TaxID=157864 RepID=A0ABD2L998_9BILA